MKKRTVLSIVIAAAVISAAAFIPGAYASAGEASDDLSVTDEVPELIASPYGDQRMAGNITIQGIDVSGMTYDEACAAADQYASGFSDVKITLNAGDKTIETTAGSFGLSSGDSEVVSRAMNYGKTGNPLERYVALKRSQLGMKIDFPLDLRVDYGTVEQFLTAHQAEASQEVKDNGLKRENGAFVFIEGQKGQSLDVGASAAGVTEYMNTTWDHTEAAIPLVVNETLPQGDREQLLAVKDKLGSFTTNYSTSSASRKNNIACGAGHLNGHVIYPGQEFSVSTEMTPRTEANGYKIAGAYENGTTVDSVGGGVCQVSSTLYNAVIRAELEVTQRSPHSLIVSYVKPSMDAAIAEGSKDFKFRNNQEYPVYIEGITDGANLTFNVYGKETRPANRTVTFESEIIETTEPSNEFHANSALPVGTVTRTSSAHTGYKAQLIKIVTVDNAEQSRDVFNNSRYKVTNNIYDVGTQSSNPDAVAAINAAIATQDKATIDAAAAAWNDAAIASQPPAQPGDTNPDAPGTGTGNDTPGGTDSGAGTGDSGTGSSASAQ